MTLQASPSPTLGQTPPPSEEAVEVVLSKVATVVACGKVVSQCTEAVPVQSEAAAMAMGTLLAGLNDISGFLETQMPTLAATIPGRMEAVRRITGRMRGGAKCRRTLELADPMAHRTAISRTRMDELTPLPIEGPVPVPSRGRENRAPGRPDDFQTPSIALLPLLPYLRPQWHIWEPACGQGNLVRALAERGYRVTGTDVLQGQNFHDIALDCDCILTNPPYRSKDAFLARCYALGKPFALLMPLTALEGRVRQTFYRERGVEVIFMDRRINFRTPSGTGKSSWFPTAWFTWGLGIGQAMTFAQLRPVPQAERRQAISSGGNEGDSP